MAAGYRVTVSPAAQRQLGRLGRDVQRRIAARIDQLGANPRPPGARALVGQSGALRVRVGDYRIMYRVDDGARLVTVEWVGHRKDAYKW